MKKIITILFTTFILKSTFLISQPPAGYYNNAAGKNCVVLKSALSTIITNGNSPQSYARLWGRYTISDIKPRTVGTGSANVIYDIYSSIPSGIDPYQFTPTTNQCGNYSAENDCYNREHSVPQSWFNGNTSSNGPATDYLHIFPTDGWVNSKRSNFIYGEVATSSFVSMNGSKLGTSAIAGFTGNVFEPIDSFKGDVARAFLYFITRYESNMATYATNPEAAQSFDGNTFPSVKIEYLKLMIKWHNLDPVSEKERNRNNAAYAFQVNRNPYIDNPSYVDAVWNATCPGLGALPVDIVYFSGKLNGNTLNLNWEVGSEINLKHYEIERSFNGTNFTKIGIQESKGIHNYYYNESVESFSGKRLYYRIKKVDKDGKYSYSDVFTIHIPLNTKFVIYPNPVSENLFIKLNNNSSNSYQMQITDVVGKLLLNKKVQSNNGIINENISTISNGTYFVRLIINNESLVAKMIVSK